MLTPSDISTLYAEYSAAILRYLMAGTGCEQAAQDLLHDTFLELCQRAHVIEMSDDIKHLLYTIAGRNLIDHYRRCEGIQSRHDIYNDEAHGCGCNYEDRMEIVRACDRLLRLPDLLRRTMYQVIGGNTPQAIARKDGRTESAVWMRISRARRMMVGVGSSTA